MGKWDFLTGISMMLFFNAFNSSKTSGQDFTVYKSWNFENEAVDVYTDAEIREDFNYTMLYSHNSASIVYDTINGIKTKAMRITHPAGVVNNGFEMNVDLGTDNTELYLSYNWKFSKEFNSTAGGKLPGLGGLPDFGTYCPESGDGFRAHNMFKQGGRLISYHYDRTDHGYSECPWAVEEDSIFINNGCWYNITQRLVLNSFTNGIANADGIKEVWLDGKILFQETNLKFMENEDSSMQIDAFRLSNFYGGDGLEYKPVSECYGYIDNIKVYMPTNDSVIGHQLHYPYSILPTPNKITDRRVYYDQRITTEGSLHNSEYGSYYSSCIDEAYLIDAGAGNKVIFNITSGSITNHDYLFFYDGNTTDAHLIDVVAGYSSSMTGIRASKGRYMFVRFSTSKNELGTKGWTGTIDFQESDELGVNSPPLINYQEFIVNEDNYDGNSIGEVVVEEDDPGQTITYSIIAGNEAGLFNINASSGSLWLNDEGVFDQDPENYDLQVKVMDDGEGNLSDQATVRIILEKHQNIVYIDPENMNDDLENGSMQHPYDSWQDIEWMSDYSYLQKRGTVADELKISVQANNILIGAYGKGDQPVIWSAAEDYAISLFEKKNVTIQGVHIVAENAIASVYSLGDVADNITIENSEFEGSVYGIRIIGGNNYTIQYNTFRTNSEAIYSYAENTKVYYNIFQNNQDALHIDGENSSAEIYNNVFYDNNIAVSTEFSELTLYNNIFVLAKAFDKAISYNGTNLISDNNIFYPNQQGFVSYNGEEFNNLTDLQQIKGIDINSLVSDPLFVDAFNQNFNVESESPAIDAGVFVGITADLTGEGVPYGNKPDIGVIEVSGAVTSTSMSPSDELNNFLRIFPNPTSGVFKIALDEVDQQQEANINIQDINGRTILEKQCSDLNTELDQSFDISDLPVGIYVLSVRLAKAIYSQRVLKVF
jgi:hypothetical protein